MSDFERTPPHDIGAEQAVTGGMLLSKDAIADVAEILLPEDHYRGAHQLIHEAILHLYGHGEPTDPVAVAHELARRKQLAAAGGAPYLHTCIAAVPTAANAGYYARIVREHSVRRRLTEVGTRLVQLGYTGDGDAAGLIDRAEAEVYGLDQGRESDEFQVLADVLPTALNDIEAARGRGGVVTGVPTGLMDLDALTGGLHGGQMVVIAARPALGKSVLALDFARSAAVKHNLTTGLFSLEMSKSEIGMRLLSAEARVPLTSLRTGQLTEDDWQRLSRRISEVAGAPLFIDDSASLTMSSIRGKSRRLRQRHDLKLIVVDYLQLMG